MKTLTFIVATFIFSYSDAQIVFDRIYGGAGYDAFADVQQTNDGGYIMVGQTFSFGLGGGDIRLIKVDENGDTLWTRTFGSAGTEGASSVRQTTDGGYIIGGFTDGFGAGNTDVYLIKTDSTGDTLWTKIFGGINTEIGHSVWQTSDGGYIIVGKTGSFGAGNYDIYLIKTNDVGDSLWTKTFGGINPDNGHSVQQTNDGGYIVIGEGNFPGSFFDAYLIKTDFQGDTLWTKRFGTVKNEYGYSVQQTSDEGFIITGYILNAGTSGQDVYLIKTDSIGGSMWTKTFGGINSDAGHSVWQTRDGGYIVAGFTEDSSSVNDFLLIKTDTNGDTLWTKTYGLIDDSYGHSVQQTSDGGYIIAGLTGSPNVADAYLIKTDCKGNYLFWDSVSCPTLTSASELISPPMLPLVSIYPNPFSDFATITINSINLNETRQLSMKFFDAVGRQMNIRTLNYQESNFKTKIGIETNGLPAGIYFYKVMNDNEVISSGKLIIE